MKGAESGYRYWRFVESSSSGEEGLLRSDLEMLRRIDPHSAQEADLGDVDIEDAWQRAAADIVEEHNRRADPPV